MRVLVDEDTAVQVLGPLRHVLIGHQVTHVSELEWKGKKDRQVLRDARNADFDALITRDRNQLTDPGECDAIKKSGLHHIRYTQRLEGMRGLALALGALIAAMPMIIQQLEEVDGQRLVRMASIEPRERFQIVDPRRTPPSPYWPRLYQASDAHDPVHSRRRRRAPANRRLPAPALPGHRSGGRGSGT